jgi:signal transduction histidine kinase/HAMP domain-containing protein
MKTPSFNQSASLAKQLRYVVISVVLFFLLGSFGVYLSSRNFLVGLTEINGANNLLDITTQINEGLIATNQNLQKLLAAKNISDAHYAFKASQSLISERIRQATEMSADDSEITPILAEVRQDFADYGKNIEGVFKKLAATGDISTLKSDLVVVEQLELDLKDALRRIQITLRTQGDREFNNVYSGRYMPLLVAVVLAILFSVIVLVGGFYMIRRFDKSITNLNSATDRVARGDLDFQAKIMDHNEIGRVTAAFNKMVKALREGREKLDLFVSRIVRLQGITAAFSEAVSASDVLEVIALEGMEACRATHGAVGVLSEDGAHLKMQKYIGYPDEIQKEWSEIPVSGNYPLTEAVRTRQLTIVESPEDALAKYGGFRDGGPQSFIAIPLLVDGRVLGVVGLGYPTPKKFDKAELDFMVAIFRQCSQALHRVQLFEKAQVAIRARDEFLSIASHELRTPMTPLKLQLQIFIRHIKKGTLLQLTQERLLEMAETSERQIGRLANLVEDLLDVSRISAGKLRLSREPFNFAEMVEEIVARYGHQLSTAGCKVDMKVDKTIVANMDRLRIEQVVVNLVTNAAKYASGKPIHIDLSQFGSTVRLAVKDEGPGIAYQDQDRIFDRFERVRSRDHVEGLGLGLYISKQIVEAHGGKIRVISKEGDGSMFIVDLPLGVGMTETPGAAVSETT